MEVNLVFRLQVGAWLRAKLVGDPQGNSWRFLVVCLIDSAFPLQGTGERSAFVHLSVSLFQFFNF